MKKRIILSGGGTAGHIWPLVSIYKKLPTDWEVLYVGSGALNERKIIEREGVLYRKIFSGKYRRYFSWWNFIDPFLVILGFFQSLAIIVFFRPQLIVAKGGYVTVPLGLAAAFTLRRLFVHESDAVPGLANRILSRFARKIFTGFPSSNYPRSIQKKAIWTGTPVRQEMITGDAGKARSDFGFGENLPVILIIGGSLGAHGINRLIFMGLPKLLEICQVVHLTGRGDYPQAREIAARLPIDQRERYRYFDFVSRELPDIFALADIVVSRSGATTLTELAALGKPAILIPYPFAASNHQYVNARILERNQAAVLMKEEGLTESALIAQVKRLLDNREAKDALSKNIHQFYKENSVEIILAELER